MLKEEQERTRWVSVNLLKGKLEQGECEGEGGGWWSGGEVEEKREGERGM